MAIKRGDKFPQDVTLYHIAPSGGDPTSVNLSDLTKGKKFVLVSIPGAYTPPCTDDHLPGYVAKLPQILRKGIDLVLVVTANDPFVLRSYKNYLGAKGQDKFLFLSDTKLELSKKLAKTIDLSSVGLGERSTRLAIIVNRFGIVEFAAIEDGGAVKESTADKLLAKL
ncbi:unnamed protein product [Kuraishia capsulata CBS 1993]|uniref:Thioredoxin domain-containing protein n=1 Tax=Kuraishia capsulata CBS 1993 TaxID=1382522 RepID=W6MY40_9ASCO|nr:uncharacterized protein KUCA_T00005965001 [Kuraishia capsulata CBS 1993]CDK29970.1 unnamed protein product [Kuraishia capsulata CBS 1993]